MRIREQIAIGFSIVLMGWFGVANAATVSGDLKVWQAVTISFDGPQASETADPNPFLDYRLEVSFRKGDKACTVCGYYAADGNAAQTSAAEGSQWRVHFVPDEAGQWDFVASFRKGKNVAIADDAKAGEGTAFDGEKGNIMIAAADTNAPGFLSKGFLRDSGKGYLRFSGTKQYFLKGGADSPENFLGYADFDGTFDTEGLNREGEAKGKEFIHHYGPHEKDWRPGDPTWKGGKGKGMIGGLNYLAGQGVNGIYFITYNLDGGDGKDVWPWTDPKERFRFDCSKLDQWNIVFDHAGRMGILLHNISQEQENDQGLDGGELGPQRKLYYRELVARFAHHLGWVWNLGEENTNTDAQRKAFATYIHRLDPYDHPVVVHTFPGEYDKVYRPLLGFADFNGPSLQTTDTHTQTVKWVTESTNAGRRWLVFLDEIAQADIGVKPDADDPTHDEVRQRHLWGNLMGGGAGVEWYFGYKFPNNDLNCEDFRSREQMWRQTRIALGFFHQYLPFWEMTSADGRVEAGQFCFAKDGAVYAVYLPKGGEAKLDLVAGTAEYRVRWFNPRQGGELATGSVKTVRGPGKQSLGLPPADPEKDWAVLVDR
jgi:hypothetical protein